MQLKQIILEIKKSNEEQKRNMAEDESNERLLNILGKHDLVDDADLLAEKFGQNGLASIRDAENGFYL